ncbi:MAG TPA: NfeD family protein [Steroidobacteraceae bacterium]|nr:NfeD family protein [Steroidobacteraceae bacterium]
MTWWAWMIVGAILLGAELAFIDAQFYLIFLGISALIVGLVGLAGTAWPEWAQWALFGALAIVSLVTFRRAIYQRLRGDAPAAVQAGPAGQLLTLPVGLAPGASCQVEYRGSFWTATNDSEQPILAGTHARIIRVHGLSLVVRPET